MRYGIDSDGWLYTIEPGGPDLIISPLPEAATQAKITPRLIINHTQAGPAKTSWKNLQAYLNQAGVNLEPHLIIEMDGLVVQLMPFTRKADCSYKANGFYIGSTYCGALSVETQDLGGATLNTTPWTDAQFESMAQVWAASCVKYAIPVQEVATWNGQGVSYHSRHPEWSADAHRCPGPARQAQMPALLARIRSIITPPVVSPPPIPSEEVDDMQTIITRWDGEPFDIEVGPADPSNVQRWWRGVSAEDAAKLIACGAAREGRAGSLPLSLKGDYGALGLKYRRVG